MNVDAIFKKNLLSFRKLPQSFSRIIEPSPKKFKILSSFTRASRTFCKKKRKETFTSSRRYFSFKT